MFRLQFQRRCHRRLAAPVQRSPNTSRHLFLRRQLVAPCLPQWPSSITRPHHPGSKFTKNPRSSRLKKSSPSLSRPASQKAPALLMSTGYRPTSKNFIAARTALPKFRCRDIIMLDQRWCVFGRRRRGYLSSGCGMTLRKLTENMTGGSNPSWITRSTIFIAGWWRSSQRVMPMPSATILTPRPRSTASASHSTLASNPAASFSRKLCVSRISHCCVVRAAGGDAAGLAGCLGPADRAQETQIEQACSDSMPQRAACRTLRRLRLRRRLRKTKRRSVNPTLARALHNASPGAYDKLAAFAGVRMPAMSGARAPRLRWVTTTTTKIARNRRWYG